MGSQLTDKVRAKYPGQYDDMSDDDLEKAVLAKHPEYKDLALPAKPMSPVTKAVTASVVEKPVAANTVEKPTYEHEKSLWERFTSPLTDYPSRVAKSIADKIDEPTLDTSPMMARLKGFGAGALQATGDLASSLTSPSNLAITAATMGEAPLAKAGFGGIASALKIGAAAPVVGHGAYNLLNPESTMGQRGMGLTEIAGGILGGMKHIPSVPEELPVPSKLSSNIAPEIITPNVNQGMGNPEFAGSTPYPKVEQPTSNDYQYHDAKLPSTLKGAKPRFNMGSDSYTPQFDSDLDKSLFIIAQKNPSRSNASYLKFVMDNTGMTEQEAMQAGQQIRGQIKGALRGQKPGEVSIPKLYKVPETVIPPEVSTIKPKYRANLDGTFSRIPDSDLNSFLNSVEQPKDASIVSPIESIEPALNRSRPEKSDYHIRVLNEAGPGNPGLSEEIRPSKIPVLGDSKNITYRDPSGNPIATAKLIQDADGNWMVEDFAADKSKGLLYGRAVKTVGEKLQELNATTPAGTVTPDALNLINKAKSRVPKDDLSSFLDSFEAQQKPASIELAPESSMNASGESAASLEALSRNKGMADRGQKFVKYDRAGNEIPLIGPDAVDYNPARGETYGIKNADGSFHLLTDNGGKVPDAVDMHIDSPTIPADKATPEVVKAKMQSGYEFKGVDDSGNFQFEKSDTPQNPPLLESEVNRAGHLGPIVDLKKSSKISEALNFPRAVSTSIDMSAPLRQGLGLVHKKEFWKAIPGMFKAWGSEEAYQGIQQSIAEKPLFKSPGFTPQGKSIPSFAAKAGLKLTDLTDLSSREEALASTWAEKIPGVRPSNRAYTAFLNKLRADTFENLIGQTKMFGADAKVNAPLAKELANFVNNATGRGSLGKFETSAVALNTMLFSPRLIASRLQTLNPMYYINASPMVRKEAIKSLFAIAVTGNALGELAKLGGATVENNPASADFRKIKIGNTRIDPHGGYQQYIVLAQRLLPELDKMGIPFGGHMKSTTTGNEYQLGNPKFGQSNRLDVAGRFALTKANPLASFAADMLRGKDLRGQPFNLPEEVVSRFIPFFLQDLKSVLTEDNNITSGYNKFNPEKAPLALPSFFGMGTQQYQEKQ